MNIPSIRIAWCRASAIRCSGPEAAPRIAIVVAIASLCGGITAVLMSRSAAIRFDIAQGLTAGLFVLGCLCLVWFSSAAACAICCRLSEGARAEALNSLAAPGLALGMSILAFIFATASREMLWQSRTVSISIGNGYVRLAGSMPQDLDQRLQSLIEPHTVLTYVLLENQGGDVGATLRTAAWLRTRGVTAAIITGRCASSCAFLALLMPRRYLAPGGALGFHDVRSFAADHDAEAHARADLIGALVANGIKRSLATALLRSRDLSWPKREWLLQDHLIDGCWDYDAQRPTTCFDTSLPQSTSRVS